MVQWYPWARRRCRRLWNFEFWDGPAFHTWTKWHAIAMHSCICTSGRQQCTPYIITYFGLDLHTEKQLWPCCPLLHPPTMVTSNASASTLATSTLATSILAASTLATSTLATSTLAAPSRTHPTLPIRSFQTAVDWSSRKHRFEFPRDGYCIGMFSKISIHSCSPPTTIDWC